MPSIDVRHPRTRTVLWVIASVGAVALTIGALFFTTSIYALVDAVRETQVDNTAKNELDRERDKRTAATAADAARAAARIEDCTTPGRECFEAQQRRTGDAVVGVNQGTLAVIAAALSCQADGITEESALARCTARRVAPSTVGRQPSPQESTQ